MRGKWKRYSYDYTSFYHCMCIFKNYSLFSPNKENTIGLILCTSPLTNSSVFEYKCRWIKIDRFFHSHNHACRKRVVGQLIFIQEVQLAEENEQFIFEQKVQLREEDQQFIFVQKVQLSEEDQQFIFVHKIQLTGKDQQFIFVHKVQLTEEQPFIFLQKVQLAEDQQFDFEYDIIIRLFYISRFWIAQTITSKKLEIRALSHY